MIDKYFFNLYFLRSVTRKANKAFHTALLRLVILKFVLCLVTCFAMSLSQYAIAENIPKEDKIKASYVFNFIRFIQWPEDKLSKGSRQPFNVCSSERNNEFNEAFSPVIGTQVNGHPLKFQQLTDFTSISHCHLLFIDKSDKNNIENILLLSQKNQVLSVSDIRAFCQKGGIIGMVNKKGKIKVEINLNAAREAGFNISSNLLEVATIVSSQ